MNKIRIEAAMLVIGLSLFLFSCEKEGTERGAGRKVAINFTVSNGGYGSDYSISRSQEKKKRVAETVVIPLDDSYFMEATLVEDPAEELRAAAAFTNGQKMRFVAYNGVTEVGSAIYTWNGSKFVPDDEPLGMEVDGTDYHFVAYSFFGDPLTEPDDDDVEAGIAPAQDVVWGEATKSITDTEAGRTVSILMKHKFSRVQVRVDASGIAGAEITAISNVVIGGGRKADLTVQTGVVADASPASPVTETLADWTAPTVATRLSGDKVFYPSLASVTVGTLKMKVNNGAEKTFSNRSVTFTQALAENTNYTVVVDVRTDRWSWSNIYWTGSALTFDRTNQGHQNYQGVFFMWGSLVGASPVGTDPILYIPPVGGGSWDSSHNLKDYGSLPWAPYGAGSWDNLPRTTSSNSAGFGYGGNYLYLNPDFSNYKGDICNYLDNAWRMPNSGEFGGTVSSYNYTGSDPANATGRGSMGSDGATVNTVYGARFFPASGQQAAIPSGVGTYGSYWSGSTNSDAGAYHYYLGIGALNSSSRMSARSVRCIKKLPTD